jgi:hypothetical protein
MIKEFEQGGNVRVRINLFATNHVGTPAPSCPAEQGSADRNFNGNRAMRSARS